MIRHLFIAALRNMAANRLQSAIAVFGLSIGITAALLMGLVIRNQLTFDHFIPGHERTYLVVSQSKQPGRPDSMFDTTSFNAAPLLKANVPEVEDAVRLMLPPPNIWAETVATLKRGPVSADETMYWADPNLFAVLPLPVFQGDLAKALRQPDGLVLPRAMARKYFGHDDAVGQIILLNGHPMTVRAVIEDLPPNGTSLKSGIFASGLASFGDFATTDMSFNADPVVTYVRLKQGASVDDAERRLNGLSARPGRFSATMHLVQLDRLPLLEALHPGAATKLAVFGMAGALILFVAAVNFVNLLTGRAARRALEVGVRKVCGAARPSLMLQFLGESILTVFFATCLAVAFAEWLSPVANAFLQSDAQLDYQKNPALLVLLLSGTVVLGLLAGAWPSFVLSSFRPAGVLKGVLPHSPATSFIRNALVVLQFAILVGLAVAATVIYQQNSYVIRAGLRTDIDQMLVVRGGCKPAFRAELRKLPGVAGASCSDISFLEGFDLGALIFQGKTLRDFPQANLDLGIFALYGIKPIAGALPLASAAGDYNPARVQGAVLNMAALKRLGIASPQAAIGQELSWPISRKGRTAPARPIIAVVPDFSFQASAEQPILSTIYTSGPNPFGDDDDLVSIKLKGQQIPETLAAIDRAWSATNPGLPLHRFFLNDYMQQRYLGMLREAQIFALFSGIAVFLACLGLLGLSIATTERRTKEIGVRKVAGASNRDIVMMLLWQFSRPVLLASLIAWPVAWYAMDRWLSGFAYHVELHVWLFAAISAAALAIALATVAGQAFLVARQKPVLALRYE